MTKPHGPQTGRDIYCKIYFHRVTDALLIEWLAIDKHVTERWQAAAKRKLYVLMYKQIAEERRLKNQERMAKARSKIKRKKRS